MCLYLDGFRALYGAGTYAVPRCEQWHIQIFMAVIVVTPCSLAGGY
jgi:hypothetical protein